MTSTVFGTPHRQRLACVCRTAILSLLSFQVLSFPLTSAAQTRLNLPINADEMRRYMRDFDNYCPTCGIVANVRPLTANDDGLSYRGVDGPEDISGNTVMIQPIFSTESKSHKPATSGKWRVTVQLDNGSYQAFDLLQKPDLVKGDPVQITEGRIERR